MGEASQGSASAGCANQYLQRRCEKLPNRCKRIKVMDDGGERD